MDLDTKFTVNVFVYEVIQKPRAESTSVEETVKLADNLETQKSKTLKWK